MLAFLPEELLLYILSFVSPTARNRVGEVSRYGRYIHRTTVDSIRPINCSITPTGFLQRIVAGFPAVKTATLTTDSSCVSFPDWSLTCLTVSGSCSLDISGIEKYTNLSELTLTNSVADLSPVLRLTRLEKLTARVLREQREIRLDLLPCLCTLKMLGTVPFRIYDSATTLVKLYVNNIIIEESINLPNLELLNCLTFNRLELPRLKYLHVTFGDNLERLTAPNLTKIYIGVLPLIDRSCFYRFPRLDDVWINTTSLAPRILAPDLCRLQLSKLQLSLPRNSVPTPHDIFRLISIPSLTELALFPTTSRHVFSLEFWRPRMFSVLVYLNLSNTNIPDSVLVQMDAVKQLIIPGSLNITDYGVITLINRRGRELDTINVESCPGLTEASYNAIELNCDYYRY